MLFRSELNPKNHNALNNLARVYFFKKKYTLAIQLYRDKINLNFNEVKPYTDIGVCYFFLGTYDSAIYYSNRAISIDPSFNKSYEILAVTYKAMNKLDSAKKYEVIAKKNNSGFKL